MSGITCLLDKMAYNDWTAFRKSGPVKVQKLGDGPQECSSAVSNGVSVWHLIERHPKLSDIALSFVSCVSCVILPCVLAFFGPFMKNCVWTAGQEQRLLGKNKPSDILRGDVVTADPLKWKSAKQKKGDQSTRTSTTD